jgi:pseudouridine synthase
MTGERRSERLHKVLAHAGVASRRKCEELIREGRVRVNGEIVKEMGVRVDPAADLVEVDDERVRPEQPVYLLLYKPRDYLCTTSDQWGRKTILDLLPEHRGSRLFTVGRLDQESEGLVIVTNDGDFAHEILHPRRRLPRVYYVKLRGHLTVEIMNRARVGVWLSDGRTPPMDVHLMRAGREISTAKCTLVERHHHQLRRIWAKLGLPVLRLVLVRIGPVGTEELKKGTVRVLTPEEVADLRSGAPGRLVATERAGRRAPAQRRRPAPGGARRQKPGPPAPRGPTAWGAPAGKDPEPRRGRPRGRDDDQRRRRPPRAGSSSSGRGFRKRGR